jgi:hypothetical protein
MKTLRLTTLTKITIIGVLTVMMIFSFSSCATKVKFATSQVAPAARGTVKVKKDNNKNYEIQIDVSNLAEVKRLQPAKAAYIVWLVSDRDETKNLGQFKSSSGMFSKLLKASFKTVTSDKPAKIFITAEDDVTTIYPGGQVILSTERF